MTTSTQRDYHLSTNLSNVSARDQICVSTLFLRLTFAQHWHTLVNKAQQQSSHKCALRYVETQRVLPAADRQANTAQKRSVVFLVEPLRLLPVMKISE